MSQSIGDVLRAAGLIDDMQLNAALAHQRQWGGRLADILVDKEFVDEIAAYQLLAQSNGTKFVSIPTLEIANELLRAVPQQTCERYTVFPLRVKDKVLFVASADPQNVAALDEIQFQTRMRVQLLISPPREIEWAIRRYFHGEDAPCPPPKRKVTFDDLKLTDTSGNTINKTIDQIRAEHERQQQTAAAGVPPYVTHEQFHVLVKSMEGMQQLLRFMVDASIARGVFTRDEYVQFVESLRRGG